MWSQKPADERVDLGHRARQASDCRQRQGVAVIETLAGKSYGIGQRTRHHRVVFARAKIAIEMSTILPMIARNIQVKVCSSESTNR
jgi:hypothetical protein